MIRIDRQYSSSAARIADESRVTVSQTAQDSDTGNIYRRTTSGWNQENIAGSTRVSGVSAFTPSNLAAGPVALSQAGDGYAISSGAKVLSIGVTVALTGTGVFIAFGTSELDAEANVSGTVGSEVGWMCLGPAAGGIAYVRVPPDSAITHFALAENHAAPTGKVSVTQGV